MGAALYQAAAAQGTSCDSCPTATRCWPGPGWFHRTRPPEQGPSHREAVLAPEDGGDRSPHPTPAMPPTETSPGGETTSGQLCGMLTGGPLTLHRDQVLSVPGSGGQKWVQVSPHPSEVQPGGLRNQVGTVSSCLQRPRRATTHSLRMV